MQQNRENRKERQKQKKAEADRVHTRLVIDEDSIYEIDLECMECMEKETKETRWN